MKFLNTLTNFRNSKKNFSISIEKFHQRNERQSIHPDIGVSHSIPYFDSYLISHFYILMVRLIEEKETLVQTPMRYHQE